MGIRFVVYVLPLMSENHFFFYKKLGLVTFNDHTHGFPRNEGFFQDCRMVRKKKCPEIVQRSQKIALMARAQCDQGGM